AMDTIVTIEIVDPSPLRQEKAEAALDWFRRIEQHCTRFDPQSEVMKLCARNGAAVPVSEILFEAVRFALAVAEETGGAFDPTLGHAMETRGFNREYQTGKIVKTII